ncbi:ATP-dependent helicase [Herbiconiux sp. SYSU D00978]|uniref:ATP-dependent helicase n=1 Tax=Herbiconiux sp. SYSU D00978 TaxID=2812562 RepID=UPI001A97D1B7|nr:ATP-dependent helicase [Herbiconiux sp. SYSU D00978]
MSSPASVSSDSLLEALDQEQRQAAEALLGPVCLLAGAGTGKTRAITHRIAYGVATGVYSPSRVMPLTFTSRAAGELRARLRALGAGGVAARTFHAAALAQLNFFWPQVIGGDVPKLLEGKARIIAHAAESIRLKLDTPALRDAAGEIEWRKVSRMTMEDYARAAYTRPLPGSLSVEQMADLQQAYEDLKDERRQIDFEDVLLATAGMIEAEPRVATQVREQYRFFVVDEYQDVSPLQQDLLDLWLGDRNDLCVVGDASQTIYSFAGASSQYLLGFGSRYPGARVIRLEQNYRSTSAIIDTANRLMRGRPGALRLTPAQAKSDASRPVPPTISEYDTEAGEARGVASSIGALISGGARPESIAVLYRMNAQAAALENALEDAGISYRIHGAGRFFDQREVKQAVLMLKGASISIVGEPLFKTVSDVLRSLGWTQEPPEARGATLERWESLNALMTMAEATGPGTTLKDFVGELIDRQQAQHEPTMSAVTLASIHSAKGLEWDHVFVVGVSEGLVPIFYAKGFDAIDEERRLLYVAITRARRRLHLSWSRLAQHQQREPSRFLDELAREAGPGRRTPGAGASRGS